MSQENLHSEKDLLLQVAAGNENAFRVLYERYHHVLYRNVLRLLHSEQEAEDVVQDVFITLWEKRADLNMERPINGWLFTLSYHRAINYLKRKLRQETIVQVVSDIPEELPSYIQVEEQWMILERAIDQLSPQKKKVFELCKLRGKTYENAALELGLSRYTVGEYLQEAMASVREYVKAQAIHPSSAMAIIVLELFLY